MASKKLQGITIEIDGNTTKLNDAISKMNSSISSANAELKSLNNALKLDPKNTELLSQKQDVLKNNIAASTDKLNQLKEAQRQMGNYNNLTEEQKENYRALSVEIAKSESAINKMNKELKSTSSIDLSKVKDSLKKVGEVAAEVVKKVAAVVTAVGGAIAGVVAKGVKSYADLEQNIGGVETLFKDNASKVIENAKKAYKTAGVSANEYMQGVTSFSASLLQSLSGNTSKAADVADMAFKDMSDNANKFGTDMSSLQNAYQGFAKQNYTMLDNLKLGYGGTKTEMERLLSDAEKLTGKKYDIKNLSDVYNAIHAIQDKLGVTGTTALEASTTISGSMNSMKAAFDNFLNGSGSPEQLSAAITTFVKNVSKVVLKLAPSILSGISTLIKDLLPEIGKLIVDMLPKLFTAAQDLISSLLDLIQENVQPLADTVVSLFTSLVMFILDNLPKIIETGLKIIIALATGIAENIDEIIPAIVDTVVKIVEILLDNIDLIIQAAFKLFLAIVWGILKAVPKILVEIPKLLDKLVKTFFPGLAMFKDIGKQLISGLWKGIKEKWENLKSKVTELGNGIVKKFKSVFGIHSPSKVMKEQIGKNLGLGMVEGIESTVSDIENAMKGLSNKVEASVNPTINPTANSNPLIIQIENFNNNSESDIQSLAQKLEFYRKNSALAKGGN